MLLFLLAIDHQSRSRLAILSLINKIIVIGFIDASYRAGLSKTPLDVHRTKCFHAEKKLILVCVDVKLLLCPLLRRRAYALEMQRC